MQASDILNMSKNTKKTKKNKKTSKTQRKPVSKKTKIIIASIIAGIILIAGIISTVLVVRKRINDRIVHVAFYGLSDDVCDFIKQQAPELENVNFSFDVISEKSADAAVLKNKYDVLFTWKGELTDSLESVSSEIPEKILSNIPRSLRNKKCMPLLLDHYEMNFAKYVVEPTGYNIEADFNGLLSYLEKSKKYVFSPFFCVGADDRTLLAFIGSLIESFGGRDAYTTFLARLKNEENFETLLDVALDSNGLSLRSVLDFLKTLPKKGFTHPEWYNGNKQDLLYFTKEKQASVFYTSLSEHRKIPFESIKNFDTTVFPIKKLNVAHAIIAPAVSCVLISDNSNGVKYLQNLIDINVQAGFSNKTMLAPVHYQAESYDRQADDVRFYAASNACIMPDPVLAVYQRDREAANVLASEIRKYLAQR